ncbi:MAG: hypothetical protein COB13_006260 [OCS116 cluster bacterium]|nr:hypothetical protein [OCS116 cluster bacterium]
MSGFGCGLLFIGRYWVTVERHWVEASQQYRIGVSINHWATIGRHWEGL